MVSCPLLRARTMAASRMCTGCRKSGFDRMPSEINPPCIFEDDLKNSPRMPERGRLDDVFAM